MDCVREFTLLCGGVARGTAARAFPSFYTYGFSEFSSY